MRELASLSREFPSNHGQVVWHPEPSCQEFPPSLTRQSKQVSVSVLGNPVQFELAKQLLTCGPGVGRGRGVGVRPRRYGRSCRCCGRWRSCRCMRSSCCSRCSRCRCRCWRECSCCVAVGVNVAVAVAVAVGVNVGVAVGVPHGPPPLLRCWTSARNWKVWPTRPPTLQICPDP